MGRPLQFAPAIVPETAPHEGAVPLNEQQVASLARAQRVGRKRAQRVGAFRLFGESQRSRNNEGTAPEGAVG